LKREKQQKRGKRQKDFVVFCFGIAINFCFQVRVLMVPVRIMGGVGVEMDGIWFVFGFVSLSPVLLFLVKKLARAA